MEASGRQLLGRVPRWPPDGLEPQRRAVVARNAAAMPRSRAARSSPDRGGPHGNAPQPGSSQGKSSNSGCGTVFVIAAAVLLVLLLVVALGGGGCTGANVPASTVGAHGPSPPVP